MFGGSLTGIAAFALSNGGCLLFYLVRIVGIMLEETEWELFRDKRR